MNARLALLAHAMFCTKCQVNTTSTWYQSDEASSDERVDHPQSWYYCAIGIKLREAALKEDPAQD